ncbi:MAG TPA: nucleotidyl transferase AbiEii/AbiGii toxin family protein [Thermoanaerobaculia bacterium]|nr:nucleotidyl transferase AbiEii/AbiGii toxin family protein [Thermoanaerobaculia bacterium]
MELDEVMRVLGSFESEGVDYIIVGGVALNFHGLIRATEDLDLFIRPEPENIERLRRALRSIYDDPSIEEISADDLLGDYPAVRYYPPSGEVFLDILTRLGEFASYDDLEAQSIEVEGVHVRVASPRSLYWLKKDTMREIDRADAEALREKFHLDETS